MNVHLILYIFLGLSFSALSHGWELEHDQDGIQIFTQAIEGSDFKAFRGTAHVKTDLHNIIAHHLNLESMADWLQDCSKSELVSKISSHDFYIYQRTSAPWPVSDRDYVLRMNITQDPVNLSVLMTFEASSDFSKSDEDCVQVTQLKGYWRFTPVSAKEVFVEYETAADPAGNVPSWLANSFVVDQPLGTLKSLRQRVENERFILPTEMGFIKAEALN